MSLLDAIITAEVLLRSMGIMDTVVIRVLSANVKISAMEMRL